jgi:hypothetical protein
VGAYDPRDGTIERNPAPISGWQREYKLAEDGFDDRRSLALPDWAALAALAAAPDWPGHDRVGLCAGFGCL